jgi:hypothetical protein
VAEVPQLPTIKRNGVFDRGYQKSVESPAGSHDCRVFAAIVGLSAGPLQDGKEGFFKLLEEK